MNTVTRMSCALVLALLLPIAASAQTPTVTGIHVNVYKTSAPTIVVTATDYPNSAITCGLPPSPATASTVNPTILEFTDATDPTKVCRVSIAAFLATLPVLLATDSYFGLAYFTYGDGSAGGTSLASNPFTRFVYLTLLGLRFIK